MEQKNRYLFARDSTSRALLYPSRSALMSRCAATPSLRLFLAFARARVHRRSARAHARARGEGTSTKKLRRHI